MTMRYDEVGYWSEIKLDIVRKYAGAYSRILAAQRNPTLHHAYIDAFAGPGVHVSRHSGDFILGSPLNALQVEPPFKEFHFIDIEGSRIDSLKSLIGTRADVHLYTGDANAVLLDDVLPRARFEDFRRALCLLDPYGLHLNWEVLQTAGGMRSVEVFINFPTMDMNRNVLWRNPERVPDEQVARMTAFWGNESWREAAYSTRNLFSMEMKAGDSNEAVVNAFRERLRRDAGFNYVPEALPMRNSLGFVVYYLVFASPNATGEHIVKDIFDKYGGRDGR